MDQFGLEYIQRISFWLGEKTDFMETHGCLEPEVKYLTSFSEIFCLLDSVKTRLVL
jgi:hypothetical protein